MKITAAELRERFSYDPETGIFIRLATGRRAGGKDSKGYRVLIIDWVDYAEHRLAWLYVYGEWPRQFIDHINCVPDDNRIANLREATHAQNMMNKRAPKGRPLKGITKAGNRWQAQIFTLGRNYYLGRFDTPEEASAAYSVKARELFGEYARVSA